MEVRCVFCGFFFLLLLPVMLSSEIPKVPTEPQVRGFPAVWKFSSFMTPSPGQFSVPNSFISLLVFYILPYLLSKRMGCLFWVCGILHQCSEVVLWKLLSNLMIFWWICGRESGLHILFLRHLAAFQKNIYFCFIDYAKTFHCVDHNKLWKILQEMGILEHLTCILRSLYAG